jgi:preprotein translocase subunit SecD
MKARMHFSVLVLILTILGVVSQQQVSVPNQEIVLQFTNYEITSNDAQDAIAIVTKQLQDLGANNILVKDFSKGRLKITYYSIADVASIKRILSKEENLELGFTSSNLDDEQPEFPSGKKPSNYDFDVYEIQKGNDTNWNLDGYVLEFNLENDQIFNPNVYFSINKIDIKETNRIVKISYRVNKNIAIAIDNTSHNIPEVRAGPKT